MEVEEEGGEVEVEIHLRFIVDETEQGAAFFAQRSHAKPASIIDFMNNILTNKLVCHVQQLFVAGNLSNSINCAIGAWRSDKQTARNYSTYGGTTTRRRNECDSPEICLLLRCAENQQAAFR